MCRYYFKKKLKLLKSKNFNYVFKKQNKVIYKEFIILSCINNLFYPRLGLIVSKKNINKSHERNRIKRLIRETFRLSQYKLSHMDFVVIVKKNAKKNNNITLINILKILWMEYYQ
ncbi:Ribonuclease P protein component [Buchnera aphidicola (Eriosoma grossulariae)]|uniref:ribonuclease P protein component n=1 Tax=Buchnera aphidicola TaxID=9 RepID=UPI0034646D86